MVALAAGPLQCRSRNSHGLGVSWAGRKESWHKDIMFANLCSCTISCAKGNAIKMGNRIVRAANKTDGQTDGWMAGLTSSDAFKVQLAHVIVIGLARWHHLPQPNHFRKAVTPACGSTLRLPAHGVGHFHFFFFCYFVGAAFFKGNQGAVNKFGT